MSKLIARWIACLAILVSTPALQASYVFDWDGPTQVAASTNYDVRADLQFNPSNSNDSGFTYTFYRHQAGTDYTLTGGSGPKNTWVAVNNPTVFNDAGGQTIVYRIQANSYMGEADVSY